MGSEHLRIVLDLDPAADPISGSLSVGRCAVHPFSGWLALTHAIKQELALARRVGVEPGNNGLQEGTQR
jgi:hypothetical protein